MKQFLDILPDITLVVGAGVVAVGFGLISLPLGLIVAGGLLIAGAILAGGGEA